MLNRIFLILVAWAGMSLTALGQKQDDVSEDSLRIAQEAVSPDFIHAYLLTISEGEELYSVLGHTAIRMVAESKGLDYCFTFEVNLSENSDIVILERKAKAGFVYVPTRKFLHSYQDQGRGVVQYELNMTPAQKQTLWKTLDEEVAKGDVWTYDININCLSMALYVIDKSLIPEKIEYPHMNRLMTGSYDDWLDYVTRKSPWMNLILKLENFDEKTLSVTDRFSLEFLKEALPYAIIKSTTGRGRPLVKGRPAVLNRNTLNVEPCWLSPKLAGTMIVMAIVLLILIIKKNKK